MNHQIKHLYEFESFQLDAASRTLLRDGEPSPLAPKAFDLLLALIEGRGRVLEKEHLMKRVWPDTFVDEANIAVTVSALRKALGRRPGGGQYIETVPKRGYRFAASVQEVTADAEGPQEASTASIEEVGSPETNGWEVRQVTASSGADASAEDIEQHVSREALHAAHFPQAMFGAKRVRVAALVAAAIATVAIGYFVLFKKATATPVEPRRLAILPFHNLKPNPETDFLGVSLADAVITKLGAVNSLVVRPSSYVYRYRDQEIDPSKAAQELKVNTLMTGSYIKDGDTLRITAQLIDVSAQQSISVGTIDIKYDRLSTVQDEVASRIIERLRLKLSSAETQRLNRGSAQDNLAYEYFLRGVDLYSRNEFHPAISVLEKTVALDPNFALAWAHLGRAYNAYASFNFGGRNEYLKAQAAYEQALTLDAEQEEAIIYMANTLTDTNRVEESTAMLRRLVETSPNLAEARWELGYAYRFAGLLEESIAECERARLLDPEVKMTSSAFNSYLYTGQYEKFIRSLPTRDDIAFVMFYRGFGNFYLNNREQAAADFDRAYDLKPDLYTQIGKALSYNIKGRKADALDLLHNTEQGIATSGVGDAEAIYKVAQGYAVLGDKESALRVLKQSIEQGFFCYSYFINDPLLENLRSAPEFASLMDLARARHEAFRRRFFE